MLRGLAPIAVLLDGVVQERRVALVHVEPELGPVGGIDEAQAVLGHVVAPLVNLPDLRGVGTIGARHAETRLAVGWLGRVEAGGELLGGAVEGVAHDVERSRR